MRRARDIDRIRNVLQRRRRTLLETALASRGEVDGLKAQDRGAEFEENAQVELADYTLSSLMESQRRELMQIDAALNRMDQGVFGECVDCETLIAHERLLAIPFAIRCGECASDLETSSRMLTAAEPMPTL